MKKNILAENMIRFNVKNLSEQTKKEIIRLIEQDQLSKSFGNTPFKTLRYGGREWDLYSKNVKGIIGPVTGTIAPSVTTSSNGETVVSINIMFPVGSTQALYTGVMKKTSESLNGPDAIGSWEWTNSINNNKPSVDTSSAYFTDGSRKFSVDNFFGMLSKGSDRTSATAFVKDILEPIMGIN